MIYTVPGVGASAERVFDTNPGGAIHAQISVSKGSIGRTAKALFTASKVLFDAMTRATETTDSQDGYTTVTRTSPGGRVACDRYTASEEGVENYTCRFTEFLTIGAQRLVGSVDFCPSR